MSDGRAGQARSGALTPVAEQETSPREVKDLTVPVAGEMISTRGVEDLTVTKAGDVAILAAEASSNSSDMVGSGPAAKEAVGDPEGSVVAREVTALAASDVAKTAPAVAVEVEHLISSGQAIVEVPIPSSCVSGVSHISATAGTAFTYAHTYT